MSGVTLYNFQEEALQKTKGRNKVAYFHDMGLGKTFTGSEKLKQLNARVNLIVCQKSKIADWIKHFLKYYDYSVYDLTTKNGFFAFNKLAKSPDCNIPIVGIINYELAWRRKTLSELKGFTLMLDESSLIQNKRAKQTKFILKLNFKNVILLSGTPCSGKYENLWTQSKLLGWTIPEDLFLSQYVNFDLIKIGCVYHKIVSRRNPYKNVERLKNKLREHGANFLLTEDCFDLPEQNFIDIKVPVSESYNYMLKDYIVHVVGVGDLVPSTPLTKRLYLRQLCGSYSEEKAQAVKSLIESTNDRLIIFYNFNEELKSLEKIAKEVGKEYSVVNGERKDLEAYETFGDSLTLVQYQAGAKGLNLQKANKIIFYSPTERCEDYMQALKRIHRIGQNRHCFYYRMMCEGSIEEKIYKALERGVDYTNDLFMEDFN